MRTSHAIALALGGERLSHPIAGHRLNVETDPDPRSVTTRVGGRKIAQQAVLERIAFGLNADCLGDEQITVGQHLHVADE